MSSPRRDPILETPAAETKPAWVVPEVTRLETGEADASDGVGIDSSGFLS